MNRTTCLGLRALTLGSVLSALLLCQCVPIPEPQPDQDGTLPAEVSAGPADYQLVAAAFSSTDNKWLLSVKPTRGGGGGGSPLRFVWDFGNGTSANGTEQTFAPSSAGVYTIRVTAFDSSNVALFTLTLSLEVPELGQTAGIPVAEAGNDLTVVPGDTVVLNASLSSDPDGDPLTYIWTQIAGTAVSMTGATSALASFRAPALAAPDRLVFVLTASDGVYESEDFVGIDVIGLGANPIEGATCTFSVAGGNSAATLDGPRPMSIVSRATILKGPISDDATLTWVVDGGSLSGPVAELETMSNVFNTAGMHVLAVALTSAGVTVSCVSTRSNTLSEQVTVWPRIHGRTMDADGFGIPGATVVAGPNGATVVTGLDGTYDVEVPHGWSGTVQAHRDGYEFTPPEKSYSNLTRDTTGDFLAVAPDPSTGCASNADCDDQIDCTLDVCDVASGDCSNTADNSACDNGVFCDGAETCDLDAGCVSGSNPCPAGQTCDEASNACIPAGCATNNDCNDAIPCTVDTCVLATHTCSHVANNAACNNGLFCDGMESCSLTSGCVSEGNPCTGEEVCDEVANACSNPGMPTALDETVLAHVNTSKFIVLEGRDQQGSRNLEAIAAPLTFQVTGQPQHGVLVGSAPLLTYIPNPGYTGPDSFLFQVSDGRSTSPPATVSIDVAPFQPPIGIPSPSFGIAEVRPPEPLTWPTGESAGSYYVDNLHPNATDALQLGEVPDRSGFRYGYPMKPRMTIPSLRNLGPNVVVEIRGGPYNFSSWIQANAGQPTAASPAFIRGPSSGIRPVIHGLFEVRGASYVIVENLHFDGQQGAFAAAFSIIEDSNHIAIRNSEFSGFARSTGATSVIGMMPNYGKQVTDVVVYSNLMHDSGPWTSELDLDVHGVAPSVWGRDATSATYNVWVLDNEFFHMSGNGVQVVAGSWPDAYQYLHHIYVGRNVGHDNRQAGFWCKQASDVIMSQNRSYGGRRHGSQPGDAFGNQYNPHNLWFIYNEAFDCNYGFRQSDTTNGDPAHTTYYIGNIVHNIHPEPGYAYSPNDEWRPGIAFSLWQGNQTRFIVNNTIYDVHGAIEVLHNGPVIAANNIVANIVEPDWHIRVSQHAVSAVNVSYTLLHQPGGNPHIYWVNQAFSSLASFVSAHPEQGPGLGDGPPMFMDAANADFGLQGTSQARNRGSAHEVYQRFWDRYGLDISVDFYGVPRPQESTWDLGALEFRP